MDEIEDLITGDFTLKIPLAILLLMQDQCYTKECVKAIATGETLTSQEIQARAASEFRNLLQLVLE